MRFMGGGDTRAQAEFPACGKWSSVSGVSTICAPQTAKNWRKRPTAFFDMLNSRPYGRLLSEDRVFLLGSLTLEELDGLHNGDHRDTQSLVSHGLVGTIFFQTLLCPGSGQPPNPTPRSCSASSTDRVGFLSPFHYFFRNAGLCFV